ncbi:SLATT domain-containing protein [Pleionea sediminis]|uniref:SLATT domain-containing protein n=1 Tax=Pleionea sediminis TaxID=2569479 RepID=UPI0011852144|nr:DUF4231 domain-containing protein [Pleionea sediminis]
MSEKLKVLRSEIDSKVAMFSRQSDNHKAMHRNFRYAAFFFTAISSFLAGAALYAPEFQTTLNISILAVSAISGAIASIEGIRKPDELWIHERTFYYLLLDLKRELDFESADGISEIEIQHYFYRLQSILESSGSKWNSDIVGSPIEINESQQT